MLAAGEDKVPSLPRHSSGLEASEERATRIRSRPAADSLAAAGQPAPVAHSGAQQDRRSLESEVARLRSRARQQDESIARLAEALRALRRAGQALRAENRELRLAVQRAGCAAQPEGRA